MRGDVWTLTNQETWHSCRLSVTFFSYEVLSHASSAGTWTWKIQTRVHQDSQFIRTVQSGDKKNSVLLVKNNWNRMQVMDGPRSDATSLTNTINVNKRHWWMKPCSPLMTKAHTLLDGTGIAFRQVHAKKRPLACTSKKSKHLLGSKVR